MEMKLELVPVPVSDIDQAKDFYTNKLGFKADYDTQLSDTVRFVQFTPPGSGCSILISKGLEEISDLKPGALKGLHLVVKDIKAARDMLASRGVQMGEIIVYPREIKFCRFADPDGNMWMLQEIPPGI